MTRCLIALLVFVSALSCAESAPAPARSMADEPVVAGSPSTAKPSAPAETRAGSSDGVTCEQARARQVRALAFPAHPKMDIATVRF